MGGRLERVFLGDSNKVGDAATARFRTARLCACVQGSGVACSLAREPVFQVRGGDGQARRGGGIAMTRRR